MLNPDYLKVLRKIKERLNNISVNWAVTGSLGFALQGVPVEPNDIDIQTDKRGAYEIEYHLSEFVTKRVKFSSMERIRSYFGELMIDGIKNSPKLPSATYFIRNILYVIYRGGKSNDYNTKILQ